MRSTKLFSALAIPAALVSSLVLAGCDSPSLSDDSSSSAAAADHADSLKDVKVTPEGDGKAPEVSVPKDLKFDSIAMKQVSSGAGNQVKQNSSMKLRVAAYKADDGSVQQENFTKGDDAALPLNVDDAMKQQNAVAYDKFSHAKVGSYFVVGAPAQQSQQGKRPATVEVYYIESAGPMTMPKDDVKKLDDAGKLPTVTFDDKQVPDVTMPDADAPDTVVAKTLKPGDGDTVKSTDSIDVKYKGWRWEDGKEFDENYSKDDAMSADLAGKVIPGWTNGLTGQKIGSTVLLVIPADLAYGDDSSSGAPTGPLVFVVDIKSKTTSSPSQPAQ